VDSSVKTLTPAVVREYDQQLPTDCETATFGLGCFWGPDAVFGAIDGIVRTRVGYAGGTKSNPSYETLGDHTEVVQVEYDPDRVSFRTLVSSALDQHSPYHQPEKRQYQHIIFVDSERERDTVESVIEDSEYTPERVRTRIESLSQFYLAEDYHQKYNLRGKRWCTEAFQNAGYDDADIRESPAAAKLNAHVAGHDVAVPFLEHTRDRSL
jgi:peptide-methionine (S)-S-oxide reductase